MTHLHPNGERRPQRLGPRPLPLHLAIQTSTWMSSFAALRLLRNGSLPWRPALQKNAAALEKALTAVDPEAFTRAVAAETQRRLKAFADGVFTYRHGRRLPHPDDPPCLWREGSTRLLDYGFAQGKKHDGPPLLVVPSLINRAYILDLTEKHSFLRALARAGFRPFLIDWGAPDETEKTFTLTDIIAGRLERALTAVGTETGRAVHVIGYCMGGLLALALAQRRPSETASLALLATPWDFHAGAACTTRLLTALRPQLQALIDVLGTLPVDAIQALFAGIAPYATVEKFRRFSRLKADSAKAQRFIALEDWLNDGVPLAGPIAKECLFGWYAENRPVSGTWSIAGSPVDPGRITMPALAVIPKQDYIVPPASAHAVVPLLPKADRLDVPAGHIGMVAGQRYRTVLLAPLADWLKRQS
jgi:polyhydroxyalkanoate synthase